MEHAASPDRRVIAAEMDQARQTFHHLLDHAADTALRRRSNGTKWTNEQLLFHMLFGYLVTRALLVLARAFGRLPASASRAFARLLDTADEIWRPADDLTRGSAQVARCDTVFGAHRPGER